MARQAELKKDEVIKCVLLLDSWAKYPKSFNQESVFESFIGKGKNDVTQSEALALIEVLKVRMKQLINYKVKPLNTIPVRLFKAAEMEEFHETDSNYWAAYAKKLFIEKINGDHNTLLDELHVISLAETLSDTIYAIGGFKDE